MRNENGPLAIVEYLNVSDVLVESWAVAVEWQVTQMEYQERGISNYATPNYSSALFFPTNRAYQYWTPSLGAGDYTSLFIDIVDDHNQNSTNPAVMDNVYGYDLAFIESNLLKHIYGFASLSTQLKANKPNGVTDGNIDDLLNSFLSPPPPPPPPPSNEGKLMQTNDGKVYSIMDGYARHIQNFNTLAGVYNYSGNIVNCNCAILSDPIGSPIGPDTSFLRDNNNDKLYFREGSYLRYIISVPIANKYLFKINNNSTIMNVYGISGYTVGPPIQ